MGKVKVLLEQIENDSIRGFCIVIVYLQDVCKLNPKEGHGKMRRFETPEASMGSQAFLRCSAV
jgi:hypothetical protein